MGPTGVGIGVPATQMASSSHGGASVALDQMLTQMNTFRSYVTILADPASKDENKLKAAQLLNEDLETIVSSPHYLSFLDHAMNIFLKILNEGEPLFIAEYNIQQLRKLILEMIHRLPSNEHLKKYLGSILAVVFKLLDIDNEENVMVALHIITELHKTYRPSFTPEYNLIPRAILSLKVLTELPIIFVLMLQLYKEQVYADVEEFIPLIMETIVLQPRQSQREQESFNREVFVDLIGAQIKILSFLAYIIKSFQTKVASHAQKLVTGMLNLLRLCPNEVASLRKELLIATKHILALDLRNHKPLKIILISTLTKISMIIWKNLVNIYVLVGFVTHIDKLFDESLLFGKGWTVHETLRPLAYSTLADLIHHVRQQLDLGALTRAVHLFSKNIHDETLPTSIQTMSCKLLLNLVDSIKNQTGQNLSEASVGQDLLIRMLYVFVNKFKSIAQVQLPYLRNKEQNSNANSNSGSVSDIKQEDKASVSVAETDKVESTSKSLLSCSSAQSYSVVDCRALVKTLVSGVKTITWGCALCKTSQENGLTKPFYPKETLVFIRFVKWAMQSLEIYAIVVPGIQPQMAQRGQVPQTVRSKEEKEVLEHFAGVFIMMSSRTFKEIFTTTINYVVERIYINPALQVVANSFLARPETSPIFATILVEYLLNHMEEMGSQSDRATLYLKLFKLVFGSVSILAAENEQMLKPYLHQIVNRSMELAMTARDPYNYFLLLRALFRSIGGGNHDILYQEFLPLLPTLLQGLNSLQSGLHKQHMKDLFVELCLTVPVRLSSLLPYLPMLMDPLVSALNGSQTLISQGLRTLELCVDNLQPDFLYEHIQPVRAELMQALWKTLRNTNEQIAQVAFRVLGKFGGGNRKMMTEPQYLDYTDQEVSTSCMTIHFPDHKAPIMLPIDKIIDAALVALRASSTESWYRQQCWEVIRGFLIGSLQIDEDRFMVSKLLTHPSFIESDIPNLNGQYYKCPDEKARKVQQTALTAMFVAAAVKDLRNEVFQTMVALVRHYTMVAVVQQAGPFCLNGRWNKAQGMDPLVLIDSVAMIMGHEERELCKPGHLALMLIINAAADILGSKERASQLPIMEYIVEKMCNLCYDRAWYAKLGGCLAISTLSDHMALKWVLDHQYIFLRALFYVMMDLTDEVSTGAIEKAKSNLERMLIVCTSPLKGENDNEELRAAKEKSLHNVTHELVRQITSSNTTVREQAIQSLKTVAKLTQRDIAEVMMPHKEVLAEMIPPKKHFILRHQPANIQIGLMDGNTFCTSTNPRMFTLDLMIPEHKSFFKDLHQLVDKDDAGLSKFSCYKNISNLIPLRKSALRALTACHYIPNIQDNVFLTIYKVLNNSPHPELQETAFECLQKYLKNCTIPRETIHNLVRPLLSQVCQLHSITLPVIQRLSYLTQLFPNTFHEKLCGHLSHHLKNLLDTAVSNRKQNMATVRQDNNDLKLCASIVDIFHQIPSASSKFIETLCKLVLHAEMGLMMEAASPFRDPLMKFLLRYPSETIQHFLSDMYSVDQQYGRFLEYLVKHEKGEPFRQTLRGSGERLLTMIVSSTSPLPIQVGGVAAAIQPGDKMQQQYLAIKLIWILTRSDQTWITTQTEILTSLQNLWASNELHTIHQSGEGIDFIHWKVPRLIVSLLLTYFKQNTNEVKLLFQLLQAFVGRYIPDFQFLREFLDQTVAQTYTVEWKRSTFFQFVEVFEDLSVSQELKAKILQHIIIPCFSVSLDRGEGDNLIGYPPAPDQDHADNVVSVFINKIIVPEEPFKYNDAVRILLLQLSCLLVEKASAHIHDAANKRQGVKLRRLMTFAWPCLLSKNCVDPATKYHGHLLLSHIIAKFAIHKRIVLQVFHSLLKAHAMEARAVVRQALEILTPAMPVRMEDGNTMLTHWTRKILIEEGHSVGQLVHILQLIVRHSSVYYPVRHHLTQHISQAVNRLGFTPTVNLDQRRLAVDLAEVCIKWEEQRVAEDSDIDSIVTLESISQTSQVKRSNSADGSDPKRAKLSSIAGTSSSSSSSSHKSNSDVSKPMEKSHADLIVYFLLRLACQVNESTPTPGTNPPGEALSKRCVVLLKRALQPDIWPNSDPKLGWLDKLFVNLENSSPNLTNISVGLELLTYLIGTLRKEQILIAIKSVTKGLLVCMTHSNQKIIKLTHNLLAKLMSTFPMDPANPTGSKFEELEDLYAKISKAIFDGLNGYQKHSNIIVSTIYGPLMMLKAACQSNPFYLDRLITPLVGVMQKMARDHLNPPPTENPSLLTELLIMALDLVKNRIGVLGADLRKSFIGQILVGLIDKTPETRVMKAITKIVEEWVKNKSLIAVNQGPTMKEKSILLVKLMHVVEKRFPDDTELIGNYLEIVIYVYQDETFKQTELTSKLEPAFLAGLRCTQPHIRAKFFQVFHENVSITNSWVNNLVPSMSTMISWADAADRANFSVFVSVKEDTSEDYPMDFHEKDMEMDMDSSTPVDGQSSNQISAKQKLNKLICVQNTFMKSTKDLMSGQFLAAVSQLCHIDTSLSEWLWIKLFPRIWRILSERQQQCLTHEIQPFIASGTHILQKDCHPSAVSTFVEALSYCQPSIPIRPIVMQYLGKGHNLWYRMALMLEQAAQDVGAFSNPRNARRETDMYGDNMEPILPPVQEAINALSYIYSVLKEEDLWAGLWQTVATYPETKMAVTYEQHGFLEQAQATYELVMTKARADIAIRPAPIRLMSEMDLWEKHWIRCAKELNQWELTLEYGRSNAGSDPLLVLESCWHVPNWPLMKDALSHVEQAYPKELAWKVNMYRGYLAICHPEEQHLKLIEKLVEVASSLCLKEWKRLPTIVSHIHLTYLQAAQQVMELQEAAQIHQGLLQGGASSLHDMKAIVKTWRNRLPVIADDLSHWSDIFTWRQHHYQFIVNHYTESSEHQGQSMLGVHASAQAIIHFGKIARKHNLSSVCLDSLSRIHTIQSVPIVDCFQKIRQQVKCYHQMAAANNMGKNELQEGLEVIESTNLKFFTKEMTAEFYALKGTFLSQLGRTEEANKALSAAVQLHDTLVKGWAMWGDYLEGLFIRDPSHIGLGVSAITCFLHASRHQNESKSRKHLAKVFWLLTFDDEAGSLSEALDKYSVGVPAIQWLPWIPQLLTCIVRPEGKVIITLLNQVGKMFPQAVYLPIRTLYLTLRIEQWGRYRRDSSAISQASQTATTQPTSSTTGSAAAAAAAAAVGNQAPIRATEPMRRCSQILQTQRDCHPTVLVSLEGIAEQVSMGWFREKWYEEILRQLRQALAKCYALAFENSNAITESVITPHTQSFVEKLVASFGMDFENGAAQLSAAGYVCARAETTTGRRGQQQTSIHHPAFQKLKSQFRQDFDFAQPASLKLHNLIHKLKKWIRILEIKIKGLPKWFILEDKCKFMSNFNLQTAEVELPGEFLIPKQSHYYIRIARFLPRVDIIQKHGTAPRRLYIRGHNGRIYPFLVVSDSSLSDGCREERVLQLMRMLNQFFVKQKETSRRLVNLSVMRVVAVSPQMRLVEDNVSSLSLLDVYKLRCSKKAIEPDMPINRYYDKLAAIQAKGSHASHQVLRDIIVKDVQLAMVPKTILKDWAISTFPNPTHYWTFRKILTIQLALVCLMEYSLHLTRLYPDMMYIHQDSGLVNVSYFKFNIDDGKGELDGNWPVPFRLTPNLAELVTAIGVNGPFTAVMVSTARCLATPSFKVIALLRAILRDEIIAWHKRQDGNTLESGSSTSTSGQQSSNRIDGEALINRVNKAVTTITNRIQTLATLDGADNKVSTRSLGTRVKIRRDKDMTTVISVLKCLKLLSLFVLLIVLTICAEWTLLGTHGYKGDNKKKRNPLLVSISLAAVM
ncbi:Transformation/transcription domain-associated protein [Armadillidium nasatum]|uniref:Transformation/transcription domain-associated protein n=1 Tax=Armadillidium nasatum TaxID=96803 RepID=A0A5N5TJE4_9CRUS|nr:Transformation/transcription domain-associated protein [Armadillidium nasatum]